MLLSEPYDKNNAILELHPGAGGTESQDWVLCCYVCNTGGDKEVLKLTLLIIKLR